MTRTKLVRVGNGMACPLPNWRTGLCDGVAAAPDEDCTPRFVVQVVARPESTRARA